MPRRFSVELPMRHGASASPTFDDPLLDISGHSIHDVVAATVFAFKLRPVKSDAPAFP